MSADGTRREARHYARSKRARGQARSGGRFARTSLDVRVCPNDGRIILPRLTREPFPVREWPACSDCGWSGEPEARP